MREVESLIKGDPCLCINGKEYRGGKINHVPTILHNLLYPNLPPNPLPLHLPALSLGGKTILITGGSSGLGLSIAKTFSLASASEVILLSRSPSKLASASKVLTTSLSKSESDTKTETKTKIHTYACDITDYARVKKVFKDISNKTGKIDILVSCAANSLRPIPVSDVKTETLKETLDVLVLAAVNLLNVFIASAPLDPSNEKIFINLSSVAAHLTLPTMHGYGSAKAAFAMMLQHYDAEFGQTGKGLRVHNVHPGAVFTPGAEAYGATRESMRWDEEGLCRGFILWLCAKGRFLRGRFVWANWDVDELEGRKEEIENDADVLRLGLVTGGLELFGRRA
ncbi:NAD(P)-binding protein [Cadophora sp. DSE1049]|nr:NAD(P)-binding protein [Cadophora sp. DSE1049]